MNMILALGIILATSIVGGALVLWLCKATQQVAPLSPRGYRIARTLSVSMVVVSTCLYLCRHHL